jgi:hypothetical protein
VWSQLENTRDAIRQETEYPLFPLAFAIHDARNRTKVATSVTEKKAVLTRLIPALTRSESVKKGEAEKCRHFTRCNVVKCYTGDASYQYIDDDLGKVLVSAEYERRYHLYLDSVCVDRDRAAACTSSKAPEKTNVRSSEIKLGCCGGGRKSEVAAAAVFIDKENALSMNGAAEEKGTSRGEEKTGLGGLRQAMWANLNALSLNGSGDNRNRGEVLHQQKPRPPPARGLNIPDPSSPKKEGKLTGRGRDINGSQGVAEIKADSGDHEGEGGGLFRLQIDVGVGCDDGACGMSSPAEIPY